MNSMSVVCVPSDVVDRKRGCDETDCGCSLTVVRVWTTGCDGVVDSPELLTISIAFVLRRTDLASDSEGKLEL